MQSFNFDFISSPEELYCYVTQQQLFERYLNISYQHNTRYVNNLPTRPEIDKKPDCWFFYGTDGSLLFKDPAWNTFNALQVAWEYYGGQGRLGFYELLDKVASDFGITVSSQKVINPYKSNYNKAAVTDYTPIQIKLSKWSDKELSYWQCPDREVTQKELEDELVFTISHYWFKGYLKGIDLENTYAYNLGDHDKWQIYQPKVKNKKYRFRQSFSTGLIGMNSVDPQSELLIITKSNADRLFTRLLGLNSVNVITETHEFTVQELEWIKQMNYRVVLLYDNDSTGIKKAQYQSDLYNWEYLTYPIDWGKDTKDCCKSKGFTATQDYLFDNLCLS